MQNENNIHAMYALSVVEHINHDINEDVCNLRESLPGIQTGCAESQLHDSVHEARLHKTHSHSLNKSGRRYPQPIEQCSLLSRYEAKNISHQK